MFHHGAANMFGVTADDVTFLVLLSSKDGSKSNLVC